MIRLIRSELFKLRTTPGPWVLVGVTLVFTILGIISAFISQGTGPRNVSFAVPTTTHAIRDLVGAGYMGATLLAPIAGILCVTSEYRHKVITTTFLTTPRRGEVVIGKVVASACWGILLCVSSLVMVAAMGIPLYVAEGGTLHSLLIQVGPVVPGLVGAFALLAVFGTGVGTLVKNQVAAVLVTIGGTIVLEPVAVLLVHHFLHDNLNWLPSEATAAVAGGLARGHSTATGLTNRLLTWWTGGLALLGWGLGSAVIGYFTTVRRDVT